MPSHPVKKIIPSKRAYIGFLEHAEVHVDNGTVVYYKKDPDAYRTFNIPYANTSMLLLGEGTSVTCDAARKLASEGVILGFTGGGGFPLSSCVNDVFCTLEPADEDRPTEYMQKCVMAFFDGQKRLEAAKRLLQKRIIWTHELWEMEGIYIDEITSLEKATNAFLTTIAQATSLVDLPAAEGRYTRAVYREIAIKKLGGKAPREGFVRVHGNGLKNQSDPNSLLDQADYVAYGAAAVALHAMGISPPFGMLHGKTRRGGLIFDIADLYKDGLCIPTAFAAAHAGRADNEMREELIQRFHDWSVIDKVCNFIKKELFP